MTMLRELDIRPSVFYTLLTFLFLQVRSVYCQDPAPILKQFNSFVAVTGTTIELQCNVTNKADNILLWFFDPDTGNEDGHLIGEGDLASRHRRHRFKVLHDADIGSYNLQIKNVMLSDAGLYTCTVSEAIAPATAGRLGVEPQSAPSSGPVCRVYNTGPLKEGEYINGTCRASTGGNTASSLQWFDGRSIQVTPRIDETRSDVPLLRKANVWDDGASYTCRETHIVLEEPRDCVTDVLEVLYKPRVHFLPVDKSAAIGSNATLTCRATSNPRVQEAPRLFVNDSRVSLTNHTDYLLSSVDSRFTLTAVDTEAGINLVFTIYGFTEEDYSLTIVCQAWNQEGERNQTTMFVVPPPESNPSNLLFILAIDIAALMGLVLLVVCILASKPICVSLCGECCRKAKMRRRQRSRRWFDRRESATDMHDMVT